MNSRKLAKMWYAGSPANEAEETELRINGLKETVEKYRLSLQDDLAAWFENSGIEEITTKQVAQVIRKWRPE